MDQRFILQVQQTLKNAYVEERTILHLADMLYNHTGTNVYTNPIDVATVIDLLEMIINQQDEVVFVIALVSNIIFFNHFHFAFCFITVDTP